MFVTLNVVFAISVLVLTASGLAVIFGLMGVVNFAHGDFVMLGAYVAVLTAGHLPFLAVVAVAAAAVAIYAVPVERFLIRPLYRRPLETILATYGLGLMMREAIRAIAGGEYHSVHDPLQGALSLGGGSYPQYRLLIVACAVGLLVGLYLVLKRTALGTTVRAVIENPDLAASQGLNVGRTYAVSFAAGAGLAGLAGALISPLVSVSPDLGFEYVVEGFLAVLIGGPGTVLGFALASSLMAGSESLVSRFLDPAFASLTVLVVAVLLLRLRPQGLLGSR